MLDRDTAVRSCRVTLAQASGGSYTTIEGLAGDGSHPLQRTWLEENVAQCGYCQPGMLLEVAALLRRNPQPSPAQVDEALADHVCRCGTYTRIRRAVQQATQAGATR